MRFYFAGGGFPTRVPILGFDAPSSWARGLSLDRRKYRPCSSYGPRDGTNKPLLG
jgi:hypothetical protein